MASYALHIDMKVVQAEDKNKKTELERLLNIGLVSIFVDSRLDNVCVPQQHKNNMQLILNLSYKFNIADFKVLDDRVEASLSFGNQDFFCIIPFEALYVMISHTAQETVVFPDSMPHELINLIIKSLQETRIQTHMKESVKPAPKTPKLALVKTSHKKKKAKKEPKTTKHKKSLSKTKKEKPHLKLIKN